MAMSTGANIEVNVFEYTLTSMFTPIAIGQFLHHTLGLPYLLKMIFWGALFF